MHVIEDIGILDTIIALREEDDADLNLQCDIFEEELSADSEAMEELKQAANVDISDPQALFKAIYSRVCYSGYKKYWKLLVNKAFIWMRLWLSYLMSHL